jgi:hypothetical protein
MAGADLTVPGDVTERDDVQALLRSGFGPLTEACFLLLRVADVVAARAWLARVHVTSMADLDTKQETVLQVALTAAGMRALGTDPKVIDGFSAEFVAGMAGDAARSRRLGDVGPDAPEHGIGAGPSESRMRLSCSMRSRALWRCFARRSWGRSERVSMC